MKSKIIFTAGLIFSLYLTQAQPHSLIQAFNDMDQSLNNGEVYFNSIREKPIPPSLISATDSNGQTMHVLKIEPLAPLTGNVTFGYERLFKNGLVWETRLGFIAAPILRRWGEKNWGGFVKIGPKFPLFKTNSSHPLQGLYLHPKGIFSFFYIDYRLLDIDMFGNDTALRETWEHAGALMLQMGGQFVVKNTITVESYISGGIGIARFGDDYFYSHNAFGQIHKFGKLELVLDIGFTVGWVINQH